MSVELFRNSYSQRKSPTQRNYGRSREDAAHTRAAFSAGRLPAGRMVAPESYPIIQGVIDAVAPDLQGYAKLFASDRCRLSVVSFYRFTRHHRRMGPPTNMITELIPSAAEPIEARLASLALFGPRYATIDHRQKVVGGKLGINVISEELIEEEKQYAKEFANANFPLRDYPNDRQYIPHLSIADIYTGADIVADPRNIRKLNLQAALGMASTLRIVLDPVNNELSQDSTSSYMPLDSASNGLDGCWANQTAPAELALISS